MQDNLQLLLSDTSLYKIWEPISSKLSLDVIYRLCLSPMQAEEHLQERIKEFKENNLQNSLILSYQLLSKHYVRQKDLKSAIKCYESLSKLTNNFNFSELANLYEMNSEWKNAILWYNKALKFEEDKAFIYMGLGICKMRLHLFDEAKNDYLEAQKIYKEEGNISEEANTFNAISYLYCFKGEADLSIKYGLEALRILKETKNNGPGQNTIYAGLYDTLGCAYELNGRLDLAKEYFLKAIAIEKSLGEDSNAIALKFISLGNVYLKQNNVDEARKCWNESLQYLNETDDSDLMIKVKRNLEKNPAEIPRIQQYRP